MLALRRRLVSLVVLSAAMGFVACGSSSRQDASGGAGRPDGGGLDAAAPRPDEAGSTGDGDGDAPGDDASSDGPGGDAGGPRTDAPMLPCGDAVSDVYVTPSSLPPMTMGDRGAVFRCAQDTQLSMSDVAAELSARSVPGVTPTTAVHLYRIAYRTYRDDGVPGASTARVYLPVTPRSRPLPVVAIAHPTEGLAPGCTPSATPTALEDLALPWAARGFAVIASDFAGLGNQGVQGYLANHDQAHSVLDSARALRALLDPGVFDSRVLLVGYSQGGGAVLAAQGLASSYGAGGDVKAAVVFAAEYFSRLDSVGFVNLMRNPTALTISTGITQPVVAAMRDYAFGYNVLGASNATATFPAGERSGMQSSLMSLCQVPFGGYLQGAATHISDVFDDAFRTGFLACVDGADAGCTGIGAQMYAWMQGDLVAPDPNGPPVLYVQGLSDTIMPPAQEAACNLQALRAASVNVQVCTDPAAQHQDVVARNVSFALEWAAATLYAGTAPSCSSDGMPACQP